MSHSVPVSTSMEKKPYQIKLLLFFFFLENTKYFKETKESSTSLVSVDDNEKLLIGQKLL